MNVSKEIYQTIDTECEKCKGTGIFKRKSCYYCEGTGCVVIEYIPFTGKKILKVPVLVEAMRKWNNQLNQLNQLNQRRMLELMIYKRNQIPVKFWNKYFTNDDAIAIMEWPNSVAYEVVRLIKLYLKKRVIDCKPVYFSERACPFCIRFKQHACVDCSYGKKHGICTNENSDYSVLFDDLFRTTTLNPVKLLDILTRRIERC